MSRKQIFKKEKFSVIALILLIGTVVMGLGYMSYSIPKTVSSSYQISGVEYVASKIEIYNNVEMGEIKINNLPKNSVNILEANWNFDTVKGYGPTTNIITHSKIGNILKIFINLPYHENISNVEFDIFINPNYELYDFISITGEANINIKLMNMNFNRFEVSTTTGGINIDLTYIGFHNDHLVTSATGRIWLDYWELVFIGGGKFDVLTSASYIDIKWTQHIKCYHDINITIASDDYVRFKYWCPLEVSRMRVELETTTGTKRFSADSKDFIEVTPGHYHSVNINDTSIDFLDVDLITTEGYVWAYIVDCFRPQRYCDHTMAQFPWNVHTNGSYVIQRAGHDVSTIEIYNDTTNAPNTYLLLDQSSDNILEINWDLIYLQGPNHGLGTIEVEVSHKIVGDILKVYIYLIYQPDLIRPMFDGGYLHIQTHPNYGI